jgi:cysteine sulfinate desulfinase/cysteine desulfurase/selenocysteine lyase
MAAHSLGSLLLTPGDEVLLTELEHHANIVPWQIIAQRTGATIRVIPVRDDGRLDLDALGSLLTERTKILSLAHISNVLGTMNPIAEIAASAHALGVTVVVDGCQAVAHERVDVRELGADLYAFGAHKMYGPLGIGVLWGRRELLERLPPYQTGGGMITRVSFEGTTFAKPPARFEPGTTNIAGAIGLGAAIDFFGSLDRESAAAHERSLHARMVSGMRDIPGITMLADRTDRAPIESFTVESGEPHEVATILDMHGVAVRAGHHCAQPLMERFGLTGTLRASIACYNTEHEVDAFLAALSLATESMS